MLDAAQKALEQRYSALAEIRRPLGHPVYAIEHGFDASTIEQLRDNASKELRTLGLLPKRWLVWAALSAEAGYRYKGDEYWPELECQDGEWRNQHNRGRIRKWFEKFRTTFGGPMPVGAWARHFNIIAWPIANAVLPRYLQPHFAEHVYDQRFALVHAIPKGADAIGRLLADEYRGGSPRFGIFLRQVNLTGQIVLALRDEDLGGEHLRISPDVLTRIVQNLETKRVSREHLRWARKVISTREATLSPRLRLGQTSSPGTGVEPPIAPVRIAGRLDGSTALLGLVFPDTAMAFKRAGINLGALSRIRVRLPGADSPWEPGQILLTYGKSDRVLSEIPAADAPLIELEGADDRLRETLEPLLTVPDRATRLLKRQSDGLYREVAGGHVRTRQSYLLLRREPLGEETISRTGARETRCSTAGVIVYALELGSRLSEAQRVELEKLGVGATLGIRVDPVGLAPATGQHGLPTWLTSEPVLLMLSADYEISGFLVSLDGAANVQIKADGGKAYISLESLEGGHHRADVQALAGPGTGAPAGAVTGFEFAVCQPEPWPAAMRGKSGFRLLVDPIGAELDAVLSGKASLSIMGPVGRTVNWAIETFDAAGQLQRYHRGGNTRVGSPQSEIDSAIDRLRREMSDAIDVAHRVDIIASLGELGRQAIAFQRAVKPVRWTFDPKRHVARLIDETDHEEPIRMALFSLSEPVNSRPLGIAEALTGIAVDPPGSLLVALCGDIHHSLFASVPAQSKLSTLRELKPRQDLRIQKSDAEAVLILLRSYWRWLRARAVGPQAILWKDVTLHEIRQAIIARACGVEFAGALRTGNLHRAQTLVGGSPGFAFRMRNFAHHEADQAALAALGACALLYNVVKDPADSEGAFRLAFTPSGYRPMNGSEALIRMSATLANATLVKGAFLAHAASKVVKVMERAANG